MIRLSRNATDQEILDVVRQWVSALAREDFGAAYGMTYHDSDETWTPQLMRAAVTQYGNPEPPENWGSYHVTPWETARVDDFQPRHEVTWFGERGAVPSSPVLGYVWFDLPLDGQWSDLTATFDIVMLDNELALRLDEMHVM
jgi:hypothetical protein